MVFLLIETSTERGLIALGSTHHIYFHEELPFGLNQSRHLMPELQRHLQENASVTMDAIAVGIGPGSYTGMRLGVSVAQALAYSWNIPLVGVYSLCGFVPKITTHVFASIIDARISGAYVLKNGDKDPQVVPLNQMSEFLGEITHLVTPCAKPLQEKLEIQFGKKWSFEERAPCAEALFIAAESNFKHQHHVVQPPNHLELFYAR